MDMYFALAVNIHFITNSMQTAQTSAAQCFKDASCNREELSLPEDGHGTNYWQGGERKAQKCPERNRRYCMATARELLLGTSIYWMVKVWMDTELAPTEVKLGLYWSLLWYYCPLKLLNYDCDTRLLNPLADSFTKMFIVYFLKAFAQIGMGA